MDRTKYIIFGAILVIYLDWARLFSDTQKIISIISEEVLKNDNDKPVQQSK